MKTTATLALVLMLALSGACNRGGTETTADQPAAATANPASLTPEQLGELGAEMRKDPARAEDILAARGMTPQSFEKAIRNVTEDPEASKRYAEAYRKASA